MQKLRHLNSSTVDKDGVISTSVTIGWDDVYAGKGYQSRQIIFSPLESAVSPTDIWIVGVTIDHYAGSVKRYACYPVLEIWDKDSQVSPNAYNSLLTHIKNELSLFDCSIVNKEELLQFVNIQPPLWEATSYKNIGRPRTDADPKITTWLLEAAGIDVDKALPKLYHKLNCDYTRDLPSLCKNGVEYFNVEFTENIDLLGYYDIVGYDYGLQIRTLPRFYEINSQHGYAEGPLGRVQLGVKK